MYRIIRFVVVFVAFFLSAYALTYVIDAVNVKYHVDNIQEQAKDPKSKPVLSVESAKEEFMSTCAGGERVAGFDSTSYCICVFDSMVADLGLNKLIELGLDANSTATENVIQPYITKCVNVQLDQEVI